MAAGNQRASIPRKLRQEKFEAKKGLSWGTQKALEGVPTVGEERAQCAVQSSY
jgi:hypothetical protein